MGNNMELNREELNRLSKMEDVDGHAWALYVLLKKNMESYTGTVHVEPKVLVNVLQEGLGTQMQSCHFTQYLENLLAQLHQVEIISDYALNNNLITIKLPIALSDTCLEDGCQH